MLTGGKLALSAIPNVEIVTLIILLTASVLGLTVALSVTLIFCTVEILLWGFGYWVFAYYVYWPLLAFICFFFTRKERQQVHVAIIIGFMSFIFGVITTSLIPLWRALFKTADFLYIRRILRQRYSLLSHSYSIKFSYCASYL
jgi:hypothetical protein